VKKTKLFFSPNRYTILSENEPDNTDRDVPDQNEYEHTTTQIKKQELPPPIYVKGTKKYPELRNAISDLIGSDSFF